MTAASLDTAVIVRPLTPMINPLLAPLSQHDPSQEQVLCEVIALFNSRHKLASRLDIGDQVVINCTRDRISDFGTTAQDSSSYVFTPVPFDTEFKTLFINHQLIRYAMKKPIDPKNFSPGAVDINNIRLLGTRVIYEMLEEQGTTTEAGLKKTAGGLFLPRRSFGHQVTRVRILAMGEKVKELFFKKDEFDVGDICLVTSKPSGALIRYAGNEAPIWTGWAHDLMARWNPLAEKYVPVGDSIFLHHVSSRYMFSQEEHKVDATNIGYNVSHTVSQSWVPKSGNKSIIIPHKEGALRNIVDMQGLILGVGGGITDLHPRATASSAYGFSSSNLGLRRGDLLWHTELFNIEGKYAVGQVVPIEDGGESPLQYCIPMSKAVGVKRLGKSQWIDEEIRGYYKEWEGKIDFRP